MRRLTPMSQALIGQRNRGSMGRQRPLRTSENLTTRNQKLLFSASGIRTRQAKVKLKTQTQL